MVSVEVRAVAPPRDPVIAFARRVAAHCPPGARVLEVGAGSHHSGSLRPLLARQPHLVAIDPDASVLRNPVARERLVTDVQEYAARGPEPFDVAFAVYVLEHVADPGPFTRACRSLLRPGGSFLALTLNVQHYFGAATWALSRLRVEERVLHRLVGANGHAHQHHHFRTEYRLNSARALARTAESAGFSRLELDCFEATANYAWYLPRGTRWVAPTWTRAVYAAGAPTLMGHLSARLVR
jgi:2-polyprenyl-3-methyl-5-hydroxy-6-metoxy-1,4-benzoquinol methylase